MLVKCVHFQGQPCFGKDKNVTLERISSHCGVSFYYKQRSNVLLDLRIMHLIGSKNTCDTPFFLKNNPI